MRARTLLSKWRTAAAAAIAAMALAGTPPALADDSFRETLGAWAERLDARAGELETQPMATVSPIGPGAMIKMGASGERVTRLARRLAELGYLTPEQAATTSFEATVDAGLRAFQAALDLRVDGVLGEGTRLALDRTPAEAAQQMRRTAQQMRAFAQKSREKGLDNVLLVNLPSQEVTLVRGDRVELRTRAIVGRPSRETPLLEDHITHIIINPTWTVPPTVMKLDKLPNLRRTGKPGISNATIFVDGVEVDPEIVDWNEVSPGRVRIVQKPGDWNALGRFRFNLTNSLNIYLHSTNEPELFDNDLRTISSGCVRLQKARALAELLLADVGVGTDKINRLLATGEPHWVKVKPLEVRFVYWTASVLPDGTVRIHPDVYDLDNATATATRSGA